MFYVLNLNNFCEYAQIHYDIEHLTRELTFMRFEFIFGHGYQSLKRLVMKSEVKQKKIEILAR